MDGFQSALLDFPFPFPVNWFLVRGRLHNELLVSAPRSPTSILGIVTDASGSRTGSKTIVAADFHSV